MLNIDDFIKRLEKILDYYGLSASAFADKIGVQRSNLSHLLSGRNKPSLDFILKIVEIFPEVDLYWIVNGKGTFPKQEVKEISKHISQPIIQTAQNSNNLDLFSQEIIQPKNEAVENLTHNNPEAINNEPINPQNYTSSKNLVEKIVYFYTNGTFKEYRPME